MEACIACSHPKAHRFLFLYSSGAHAYTALLPILMSHTLGCSYPSHTFFSRMAREPLTVSGPPEPEESCRAKQVCCVAGRKLASSWPRNTILSMKYILQTRSFGRYMSPFHRWSIQHRGMHQDTPCSFFNACSSPSVYLMTL